MKAVWTSYYALYRSKSNLYLVIIFLQNGWLFSVGSGDQWMTYFKLKQSLWLLVISRKNNGRLCLVSIKARIFLNPAKPQNHQRWVSILPPKHCFQATVLICFNDTFSDLRSPVNGCNLVHLNLFGTTSFGWATNYQATTWGLSVTFNVV